jgi:hypothetical protein
MKVLLRFTVDARQTPERRARATGPKAAQALGEAVGQVRRVPAEELVGAVAAEAHPKPGLADGLVQRPRRHQGAVGQGLTQARAEVVQRLRQRRGGEGDGVVGRPDVLGHQGGGAALVKAGLVKGDGEGVERGLGAQPGGEGEHGGGVDAPGERHRHGQLGV